MKINWLRVSLCLCLCGVLSASAPLAAQQSAAIAPAAQQAVLAWTKSLKPQQREQAVFAFGDEERENWHFFPKVRGGVPLSELSAEQRQLAMAMLQATLSERGLQQTKEVMLLEDVLGELENRREFRDSEKYYVAVFGDPEAVQPWGWRFEGHHLSLNYSSLSNRLISSTPAFFGASPARVATGEHKGLRPLGPEEDVARRLVKSLTDPQREKAIISATAPKEIITGANRVAQLESREGLPVSELSSDQRMIFQELVDVYFGRFQPQRAQQLHDNLRTWGDEDLVFAWAGSLEPGEPHYYRIIGSELLIEYDNTQNNANHAHTVLRLFGNDFARDVLKEHYEQGHGVVETVK